MVAIGGTAFDAVQIKKKWRKKESTENTPGNTYESIMLEFKINNKKTKIKEHGAKSDQIKFIFHSAHVFQKVLMCSPEAHVKWNTPQPYFSSAFHFGQYVCVIFEYIHI